MFLNVLFYNNGAVIKGFYSGVSRFYSYNPFFSSSIVNEDGASIYSVTKEAEAEMPGLDPNLRSAVSIARRLQDPLVELVKIEPKHLGIGMYQVVSISFSN